MEILEEASVEVGYLFYSWLIKFKLRLKKKDLITSTLSLNRGSCMCVYIRCSTVIYS
ncbi:hypothetical protein CDL12_26323 [Handroanthus impetiginosus]|uniref:Uncharacterized protein n=1 Tax=Handroanthus impetiginosus TaxID=429701 RepID=A0A2G9G873_9LAMI|nr:hypothetical protein CDL12_26323 [Handroanthus impetiginosus]